MKFTEINPWTERSECRRYQISMSTRWRDGKPFWSAWKCDELVAPKLLLVSASYLDCIVACATNAQKAQHAERAA